MRNLEARVAQLIQLNVPTTIEVREGERNVGIPKDQIIVVNLESKRPKTPAYSNVFECFFKIELRMHYAESTEQEMQIAGDSIHFAISNKDAFISEEDVLYHQIQDVRKRVLNDMWIQEFTLLLISVDKES